jgi:hypothetical protein
LIERESPLIPKRMLRIADVGERNCFNITTRATSGIRIK